MHSNHNYGLLKSTHYYLVTTRNHYTIHIYTVYETGSGKISAFIQFQKPANGNAQMLWALSMLQYYLAVSSWSNTDLLAIDRTNGLE